MRLLLLEDEAAIRSALTRALGKWGYTVTAAASLAEARERLVETPPEGLVSDLKLPDGSGLDLARELAVPFVLMSGYASFDDAVAALRLGCVDFLTKPVAMKSLREALGKLGDDREADALTVFAPGEDPHQATVCAADIHTEAVFAQALHWHDRDRAEAAFHAHGACAASIRERQVLAELMQAADAGRVVVNHTPRRWRAWLDAVVDWEADVAARDRRACLEDLADRALFRPRGVIVECRRDG